MGLIAEFIARVQAVHAQRGASEHSYSPALEALINSLDGNITALNEPKRVACGAPDFNVYRGEVLIGNVEAKDIGIGLRSLKGRNKQQQDDYRKALPNLIYTNCLDWDFFRNGSRIASVTIATYSATILPQPDQFEVLDGLLRDFIAQRPQTISSPKVLARLMAGKAVLIKGLLANALRSDQESTTELASQYKAFRDYLLHDISPDDFADIYAETISYGMFAARLHDNTLDDFSREEALRLLPKSNPFLRNLFAYVAGPTLDERLIWIIDDLANVLQAANVADIMKAFGALVGRQDPFIHFYETFLAAYNPKKRKARGVWYTPEPVVHFIVQSVHEILQDDFSLADGLADTSRVTVDWDTGQNDKKGRQVRVQRDLHRVQILDPATGTGTFLAEVVKLVAPKVKSVAGGMWSHYVEEDLIPRLHGFEILMASYTMCHMKLDMILAELGYLPSESPPRLSVYLTNSLEKAERDVRELFVKWLTTEARQANKVKRQLPIMCIIGNPPYSGQSQNMGEWIGSLIEDYKYIADVHFKEKKHWLHDDYVKFIRMAESLIERSGEGVVGLITNHSYLDNPTFRGMRWHLMQSFDSIRILNLHGNAKRAVPLAAGAERDVNVFDIQQGVSIGLFSRRTGTRRDGCRVFYAEVAGSRERKYEFLLRTSVRSVDWSEVQPRAPYFEFRPVDRGNEDTYHRGVYLPTLMPVNGVGMVTARDHFTVHFTRKELQDTIRRFLSLDDERARSEFNLRRDVQSWTVASARGDLEKRDGDESEIDYRPFDRRWTYYSGRSNGFIARPINTLMCHLADGKNIALAVSKQQKASDGFYHVLAHERIMESSFVSNKTSEISSSFPLYLYPGKSEIDKARRVNLEPKHFALFRTIGADAHRGTPDEMDVFDYVYGILHCPAYRRAFREFLRVDFPWIPWPNGSTEFWSVSDKGRLLRLLHLMRPDAIGDTPYAFEGDGPATIERYRFWEGCVWINDRQRFTNTPENAWRFTLGGYQPAQKWLKDRVRRTLSFDDVRHYQRLIRVLAETDRIMQTIDFSLLNEASDDGKNGRC